MKQFISLAFIIRTYRDARSYECGIRHFDAVRPTYYFFKCFLTLHCHQPVDLLKFSNTNPAHYDSTGHMREANTKRHGQVVERGVWRLRSYQELRELHKDLDIVADIGMDRTCSKNGSGKES